ncbi:hypothetical protein M9Y10_001768 [Tritrichomonas musculus]|uniref:Protein kinase domain-containing protein n=1 Tax=Tritrichomonas musculus TaxID=1915356 RepID=A0ABR2L7X7_9EUKA
MSFGKNEIPLDFSHPKFTKNATTQPIFPKDTYHIKFLPNFFVKLSYLNSDDPELPKFISNIKTKPFIILESLQGKPNEYFKFLLIYEDNCLIVSVMTPMAPLFLYDFFKSISSTAVIFPNQKSKLLFEDFFNYTFFHTQYYNDNVVVHNLLHEFKRNDKFSDFFNCYFNNDSSIKFTLYEAISQSISSVFAYFVKRHDFYRFPIKVNCQIDLSKNYVSLFTISQSYNMEVIFNYTVGMLFIFKHFTGEESVKNAHREQNYNLKQLFHPIIDYFGIFGTDSDKFLAYEYTPFFKINDNSLSKKTVENCLYSLLKQLDFIHSIGYIINELNTNSILFTVDNSVFFCNYHQFELQRTSSLFSNDMYKFGQLIELLNIENKYLNEMKHLPKNYFIDYRKDDHYVCYPVTQYFILRINPINYFKTLKETSETNSNSEEKNQFKFNEKREDNKILLDKRKWKNVGIIKTLLFCYSKSERDIDDLLRELPSVNENPNIYLSFGEDMLEYNENKGLQILNIVINSSTNVTNKEKAFYIIGRYYFMCKNYEKTQEFFRKIQNDGKILYIIGRMYQLRLISSNSEESYNYKNYYKESTTFKYWRAFYQEGLMKMTNNQYKEALESFKIALNQIADDLPNDVDLFGLLGDNHIYTYGLLCYNIALCYQKEGDYKMMTDFFETAEEYDCRLAYAPLAYIYISKDQEEKSQNGYYLKSYEYLQKALNYLPLNFELLVHTIIKIIDLLLNGGQTIDARKFLNLAIKLIANSQKCNENTKNLLIKNVKHFGIITANQFNDQKRLFDAFPCYAFCAAFNSPAGFIGLATSFLYGRGTNKNILNALICLKEFFKLYDYRDEIDNNFITAVDEYISLYPVYMQRTSYFEIGSVLFRASKSPYLPFDFLIKAASLTIPEATISDIKYIDKLDIKIHVIFESIFNHYQYKAEEELNKGSQEE